MNSYIQDLSLFRPLTQIHFYTWFGIIKDPFFNFTIIWTNITTQWVANNLQNQIWKPKPQKVTKLSPEIGATFYDMFLIFGVMEINNEKGPKN